MDFHYQRHVGPGPLVSRLKAAIQPPEKTLEDLAHRLQELDEVAGEEIKAHAVRMAAIKAEADRVRKEYDELYKKNFG